MIKEKEALRELKIQHQVREIERRYQEQLELKHTVQNIKLHSVNTPMKEYVNSNLPSARQTMDKIESNMPNGREKLKVMQQTKKQVKIA